MLGAMTGEAGRARCSGCSPRPATAPARAARPRSTPSGVDGLVVPTPAADPGDFVDGVDNPWLPLVPGHRCWTYRATGDDGRAADHRHASPTGPGWCGRAHRRRPRRVTGRPRRGSSRNLRLVRAGPRRQRLVLRRGHHGVRRAAAPDPRARGRPASTVPRPGWRCRPTRASATATPRSTLPAWPRTRPRCWRSHATRDGAGGHLRRRLLETEDTTPLEPGLVEQTFYARGRGAGRSGDRDRRRRSASSCSGSARR